MCVGHFLAQLESLPISVFNRNNTGLISTSPYNKICPINILSLFLYSPRLHHLNSFLLAPNDFEVQVFRISSQARKRIEVAVLFAEFVLFKLVVSIFLGIRDLIVENFNLFTEEDFYVSLCIVRKRTEVKLPIIVVKEAKTNAKTIANLRKLFLSLFFWAFVWRCDVLRILLILLGGFVSFQIDQHRSALAAVNAVFN